MMGRETLYSNDLCLVSVANSIAYLRTNCSSLHPRFMRFLQLQFRVTGTTGGAGLAETLKSIFWGPCKSGPKASIPGPVGPPPVIHLMMRYRVFHQLVDLGWVDFDLSSSTVCLILLRQMRFWQNWLSNRAIW